MERTGSEATSDEETREESQHIVPREGTRKSARTERVSHKRIFISSVKRGDGISLEKTH